MKLQEGTKEFGKSMGKHGEISSIIKRSVNVGGGRESHRLEKKFFRFGETP